MIFSGQIFSDELSKMLSTQAFGSSVDRMKQLVWPLRFEQELREKAS